ncbi:hypothetical protein AVEN_207113-1 [Araneus ventricosus]|uniref:Uncharacterized protein n=1 Tax=Araneus ventricosus TaxID=182803 RepID=A0A4Y2SKP1_ARAVE|nr:hypothetical protein AVEN_207113-1 [Araneus ventricosus]
MEWSMKTRINLSGLIYEAQCISWWSHGYEFPPNSGHYAGCVCEEQSEDKAKTQNGGIRLLVLLQGINKKQRSKTGIFFLPKSLTSVKI